MPHVALQMALEFHETMGQAIGDPRRPDIKVDQDLRVELIREEFEELKMALAEGNIVEAADALADLQYVINGAAASWGIDLASVYEEVHRSNMSKAAEAVDATNTRKLTGQKRADGKVMKGPNYSPPDVAGVLKEVAMCCAQQGFGEDGFWPEPTVKKVDLQTIKKGDWNPESLMWDLKFEEPPPVSPELKQAAEAKAREMAKDASYFMDDYMDEGANDPELDNPFAYSTEGPFSEWDNEEPTNPQIRAPIPYNARIANWGGLVFDCDCGRSHSMPTTRGSRGGMASKGTAECMCGKAYVVTFRADQAPEISETTIEELRKVQNV